MAEKDNHTSISYDDDLKKRIDGNRTGSESRSQFVYNATVEKCNRMDKRNEQAIKAARLRDIKLFKPIIADIIEELKEEGVI